MNYYLDALARIMEAGLGHEIDKFWQYSALGETKEHWVFTGDLGKGRGARIRLYYVDERFLRLQRRADDDCDAKLAVTRWVTVQTGEVIKI